MTILTILAIAFAFLTIEKTILETCDIWDTDYNSDNREPELLTTFVTSQLRVTLDSIRNSCNVSSMSASHIGKNMITTVVNVFATFDHEKAHEYREWNIDLKRMNVFVAEKSDEYLSAFQADWMCGPTCAAPQDVSMTCDQCVAGIKASIDQLVWIYFA